MRKVLLLTLVLLAMPSMAGEPPIVECTTDMDCQEKNFWVCGGPYERKCDNKE